MKHLFRLLFNTRRLGLLTLALFLPLSFNPADAGKPDCDKDPNHPSCKSDGDGSELGPYNLARASFNNFGGSGIGNGGISADGKDTCTILRNDEWVTYDYWAWEERLLGDDESIHSLHSQELDPYDNPCNSHDNRSDVSGGGRWKLLTTAGPDADWYVARWLDVDFSESPTLHDCPNLDAPDVIYVYNEDGVYQHPNPHPDSCVDSLNVWISNRFMLKKNADFGGGGMTIAHWPETDGSGGWRPWGKISYKEPLHLWDPPYDVEPFVGRDCRVMSTRPKPTSENPDPAHDRMVAELYKKEDDGTNTYIGTYNLPQEVCVIRASD